MAPKLCLDRPDFILSLNIRKDQSLTGHVYASVPIFVKYFIQVGYLWWSQTFSLKSQANSLKINKHCLVIDYSTNGTTFACFIDLILKLNYNWP